MVAMEMDEGIASDSESPTSMQSLIRQIHDKEQRVQSLQAEVVKVTCTRFNGILYIHLLFFLFILFPLFVGPMYDDIRLHVARSYTSSPVFHHPSFYPTICF